MDKPNKALGQHWLKDKAALEAMLKAAAVTDQDTILEIGPGLGHLTRLLVDKAAQVYAVELDRQLATELANDIQAGNLEVMVADILEFDLTSLPPDYKVVANIPYYLTSNLLRVVSESSNPPLMMALLVQKEVAERLTAVPGQMSLLSVSTQLYYEPKLGQVVPAGLFTPEPKVDSQIVSLVRRPKPLFEDLDSKLFFQLVKAGFAGRRKKLRSSLAAGLRIPKDAADKLLAKAGIDGNLRAQQLSLQDWHELYLEYAKE